MRAALITAVLLSTSLARAQAPDHCPHPDGIDEDALLRDVEALATTAGQRAWPRWDKRRTPERMGFVDEVLALTPKQERALKRDGFVISSETRDTYAYLYHLVYTQDLPLFVTMDSLFYAVGAGYEAMLASLETRELQPRALAVVSILHGHLPVAGHAWDRTLAHDVDTYLAVARSLLSGKTVALALGGPTTTRDALLDGINRGSGLEALDVFGRPRTMDFSLYLPRGPYALDPARGQWFRAAYFLQMFELNLVTRGNRSSFVGDAPDPRETPREAAIALALAELVRGSGMTSELARLEAMLGLIIGERADVAPRVLSGFAVDRAALRDAGRFDALQADLARAIGAGFARSTATHPMTTVSDLPVITTLLGVRTTESTEALAAMLTPAVPRRTALDGADVAYALGHDRALVHLASELAEFALRPGLRRARTLMREVDNDTLRGSWLDAIAALSEPVAASAPSFMRTPAFADQRLNSALAAYTHLRHANVLLEAQSYTVGGCDIPDAFVEPAPKTLAALRAYAERGLLIAEHLDPKGTIAAYYRRLARIFAVLDGIVQRELAGTPLTTAERVFLHQIAEREEELYNSKLEFDGWYFDLYFTTQRDFSRGRGVDAPDQSTTDFLKSGAMVVDVATAIEDDGHVSHLATAMPSLGVFVVDTGGPPRATVGPLAAAFTTTTAPGERLTDETVRDVPPSERHAPWLARAPWLLEAMQREPSLAVMVGSDGEYDILTISSEDERLIRGVEVRVRAPNGRQLYRAHFDIPPYDTEGWQREIRIGKSFPLAEDEQLRLEVTIGERTWTSDWGNLMLGHTGDGG